MIASLMSKPESTAILDGEDVTDFSNNWVQLHSTNQEVVNFPVNYKDVTNSSMIFEKKLPVITQDNNYLLFRTFQADDTVFIDGIKVYEYKHINNFFKKVTGSNWNLISLKQSDSGKTLRIEKTSKYDTYKGVFSQVYLGTKAAFIEKIIKEGLFGFLTSIVMLIIGLLCMGSGLFINRMVNGRKMLYLGLFSIICSFWSLGELRIFQLFTGNITFISHFAFLSLNLGIISFLMFISTFDFYAKDITIKRLTFLSLICFFLLNILHVSGIMDYFQSLILTHICIVLSVGYITIKFLYSYKKSVLIKEDFNLHMNLFIFFLIAISDLIRFYIDGTSRLGTGIRLGLCYFIISMTLLSIRQMSKAFSERLELQFLKKIAFVDSLTKTYNRTAFDRQVQELEQIKLTNEISVITVDMNNLKYINDNYGHHMGDKAISIVSRLLMEHFKKYGKVYRLGGDEFAILANENLSHSINHIFENLNAQIKNEVNFTKLKPLLAYGHVLYREGKNFEEVLRSADSLMYLCKERMKNMQKLNYIFET